jgi:hypothetical protein
MNRQEEIILPLDSVAQLIEPSVPSPFLKRRLREDAEKFIIEQAMALPGKSDVKLILCLPDSEAAEARVIPEAFHLHFAYRRDEAEKPLRRIRQFGWRSLLIAFVFLGGMILLVRADVGGLPLFKFSVIACTNYHY